MTETVGEPAVAAALAELAAVERNAAAAARAGFDSLTQGEGRSVVTTLRAHQSRNAPIDLWLTEEIRLRGVRENAAVLAVLELLDHRAVAAAIYDFPGVRRRVAAARPASR